MFKGQKNTAMSAEETKIKTKVSYAFPDDGDTPAFRCDAEDLEDAKRQRAAFLNSLNK